MSGELVLIDRGALLVELQQAFDAKTSAILLGVLDKVAAQVHASGVTREDFSELKQIVEELAEAQRRTEKRIEELAEAQRRTEERVKELAEAQRQTEEQLDRLEAAMEKHTEAIDQLRKQVGGLSDTVGGDIEDIAYIVLHDVLKREFGWDVGVLERTWQMWGNKPEEVNVFGTATDPARPEKKIWIVGEAKHNLTAKEVEKFIRQAARARQHLVGEIFPVCFCYRARPEVFASLTDDFVLRQQQVKDAGIRLVFSYGKLV